MARYGQVSATVVKRLPRYHRFLGELMSSGIHRISSRELAQRMKLTASQIRQDLNCFGGFGQQGYGYNVDALYEEIGNILGLNNGYRAILLGAGNLGRAIATHMSFESKGFRLIGIFDQREELIGQSVRSLKILPVTQLDSFCRQHNPEAAVLCIPKEAAEGMARRLIDLGIRAFWNFSHYDLAVQFENVTVENVHLGDSLMTLCYYVHERGEEQE